jgi:hypothetical protein
MCWSSNVADARNRFVYVTELYVFSKYVVPKLNPLMPNSSCHTAPCMLPEATCATVREDSVICLWLHVSVGSGLMYSLAEKPLFLLLG